MTQWGLDSLFNPAKRHMDEEKRRLQATREEIGDSSGGKRIDLESGKVVIRRTGTKSSEETVDPDETAGTEDTAEDTAEDTDDDTGEDTARAEPEADESEQRGVSDPQT
jgi:hypothetical protein